MLDQEPRNFADHQFSIGVGAYATRQVGADSCDKCQNSEYVRVDPNDYQDIITLSMGQENVQGGTKTFEEKFPGECVNNDPNLEFFVEKAKCYNDLAVFGNPGLRKGQHVELDIELDVGFRACHADNTVCTDAQL